MIDRVKPLLAVDTAARSLTFDGTSFACSLGKGGACAASEKREGDGCTPLGLWPVRGVLLRPDRIASPPPIAVPWRWIRPDDGWSDGADDPAYNRPVHLPRPFSAERLWRDDAAYDVIVVLGHNDSPPIAGAGSAIFFHLWVADGSGTPKPTEGCIAVARETMLALLPRLAAGTLMRID